MGRAPVTTDYTVSVMATDSNNVDTVTALTVTIHLVDVDDAPEITLTTAAAPVRIEHEGGFAIERAEGNPGDLTISTFSVDDDDGGTPALSLSGADASLFRIGPFVPIADIPATAENSGTLYFRSAPDFEAPADSGSNNVYDVTIVANDGRNATELALTVKVTNVDETGRVRLAYQQPVIGQGLPALVTDPDGGFNPFNGMPRTDVTSVRWSWHRSTAPGFEEATECLGGTVTWDPIDPADIPSAGTDTYIPQGDMDATISDNTRCLRATARYIDRVYAYPDMPNETGFDETTTTTVDWGFYKTVTVISGVVRVTAENVAPVQNDAVRYVPEGTPRHKYVDIPVMARDPGDTVVYALGGSAATSFYIAESMTADDTETTDRNEAADPGQIRVGARTTLDHEDQDAHMVEVTATDTYNASDSGDVIINVVNVDEAPVISAEAAGTPAPANNAPEFPATEDGARSVAEDTLAGENIGAPVEARDEGALTYTLRGANAASFNIVAATGQLRARSALDYETKNSYTVTVRATDGEGATGDITVTINVTNVKEDGTVSLSSTAPRVGVAITASVTDLDRGVTRTSWQWASSATMGGPYTNIASATNAAYTPVADDAGNYLRATASYTDGYGADTAEGTSANAVAAADAADTLLAEYDLDGNGRIEKAGMLGAIRDYQFGSVGSQISKADMLKVIRLYQFPPSS